MVSEEESDRENFEGCIANYRPAVCSATVDIIICDAKRLPCSVGRPIVIVPKTTTTQSALHKQLLATIIQVGALQKRPFCQLCRGAFKIPHIF